MKRLFLICFFITSVFWLGYSFAFDLRPQIKVLTEDEPNCTIRLPSNSSTGYSWSIQSYDDMLLQLNKHHYIASETERIGAGGYEEWQFEATAHAFQTSPRTTVIEFIYTRPWEQAQGKKPIDTKNFKIVIR